MIEEGLKAVKKLSSMGIKTNVTLIFSANQALLAAQAGASYVSPFVGRLDDISHHGMDIVEEILDIYENYLAGHQSGAKVLGLFQVSVLHNIVHLLFGVAGLAMARTVSGARTFLVCGGAIYLVLWLYGLVVDHGSGAYFIPVNGADNWLHFLLGIGMVALGLLTTRGLNRR